MKKTLPLFLVLALAGCGRTDRTAEISIVKYNNPGLTVDLEEGLWPHYMPLDWDGDGLPDLLLSITSTPNRGLYLYHNIGTREEPLFDVPQLIGESNNGMYPSYVDGELRVLCPAMEFLDFRHRLYADTLRIEADSFPTFERCRRNKWVYADWDGDGDLDIVGGVDDWSDYFGGGSAFDSSGKWMNGPLHGWFYLLEYKEGKYYNRGFLKSGGGSPLEVYGYPSPMIADWDGDGDLDIISGDFLDRFTWFENVGTRQEPVFRKGRILANDGGQIRIHLQMLAPVAYDFDGDGLTDILAGEEDSRISFIRNTGLVKDSMPQFEAPAYLKQVAGDLKYGSLVTPFSVDWDGDGDEDLIVGNASGNIAFFENLTGGNDPSWAVPVPLKVSGREIHVQAGPNGSIQGPCEEKWGYVVPSVADWDGDGRLDIIINSIWGEVLWYRGTDSLTELEGPFKVKVAWDGEPMKPSWNWWNPGPTDLVSQWRTSAYAIDWNGDGLMDLVMLDSEGYLCLFERFLKNGELWLKPGRRIFHEVLPEGDRLLNPVDGRTGITSYGKSGRRKFCLTDWDGDGDLDLLIDDELNVTFYENVTAPGTAAGTAPADVYFVSHGSLSERKIANHDVCPTAIRWRSGGVPDLLIGGEDGHFYRLRNPRASGKVRLK